LEAGLFGIIVRASEQEEFAAKQALWPGRTAETPSHAGRFTLVSQ
jgi:hypothetical protein